MKRKSKNVLLLIVIIAILGIGVGYAALSQNLILNGVTTTKKATDWDVKIDSIETEAANSGASEVSATKGEDGTTAEFAATLIPGGSASFKVVISNNGTIPAKVGSFDIKSEGNNAKYTQCSVTPDTGNAESLEGGKTHTFIVTMEYVGDVLPEAPVEEKFTITFPYTQAD